MAIPKDIIALRTSIDQIDQELLSLLKKRLEIAKEIGKIKKVHKLDIFDTNREKELLNSLLFEAENKQINKEFVTRIYRIVLDESKRNQIR